ncbi:MAG: YbhB/YbcL family Raf kinase inhibitor-like protein [Gammaproteobacteria bacterium]|nr:YbhB/YbcL family Raf kinase inhibitor-like protein [Gammaproteobacteria bacterium]
MFDTLTVIAYLLGNDSGLSDHLRLKALFSERKDSVVCVQHALSPQIKWQGVPPEANSLAIIIKDAKPIHNTKKNHYYWVVYNLPVEVKNLPVGGNDEMNKHNEGVNSWGQRNYHTLCWEKGLHPVVVELYALDKRFSTHEKITGEVLEQKMKGHILAKQSINYIP